MKEDNTKKYKYKFKNIVHSERGSVLTLRRRFLSKEKLTFGHKKYLKAKNKFKKEIHCSEQKEKGKMSKYMNKIIDLQKIQIKTKIEYMRV